LCELSGRTEADRQGAEAQALTLAILHRTSGPACLAVLQWLSAVSIGKLDRRELKLVSCHLRGCPDCRSRYRKARSTAASSQHRRLSGLQQLLLRPFADWQIAYVVALLVFLLAAPLAYPGYSGTKRDNAVLPASLQQLRVAPRVAISHLKLYSADLESGYTGTSLRAARACRALLQDAATVSSRMVDFTVSRIQGIAGAQATVFHSLENLWTVMVQ